MQSREHLILFERLSWWKPQEMRRGEIVHLHRTDTTQSDFEAVMIGGSWTISLGCHDTMRSAERSANRLPYFPQRC
jgi:hypothetical protein